MGSEMCIRDSHIAASIFLVSGSASMKSVSTHRALSETSVARPSSILGSPFVAPGVRRNDCRIAANSIPNPLSWIYPKTGLFRAAMTHSQSDTQSCFMNAAASASPSRPTDLYM